MTTVKPQGAELDKLKGAARMLKAANAMFAVAKKDSEAAKEEISKWLKSERQIDLETLQIGEFVNVEGVCIIEKAKQNKFDEKGFLVAEPKLHEQWKKDLPITKYKPVI